jgi:hypothetical protein
LRLAAQENQTAGVVLASRLEGCPGDGDGGASCNYLLDAAAGAVQFDAKSKLLVPALGHDAA